MSSKPAPGKLRGSNIFLKKDAEKKEKKKPVAPPPTPPPASKFTPEAVARRESKRKSVVERDMALEAAAVTQEASNSAAAEESSSTQDKSPGVVPPSPSESSRASASDVWVDRPSETSDISDYGASPDPLLERASFARGSRSLPKVKKEFRSSIVSSKEEMESQLKAAADPPPPAPPAAPAAAPPSRPAMPPPPRTAAAAAATVESEDSDSDGAFGEADAVPPAPAREVEVQRKKSAYVPTDYDSGHSAGRDADSVPTTYDNPMMEQDNSVASSVTTDTADKAEMERRDAAKAEKTAHDEAAAASLSSMGKVFSGSNALAANAKPPAPRRVSMNPNPSLAQDPPAAPRRPSSLAAPSTQSYQQQHDDDDVEEDDTSSFHDVPGEPASAEEKSGFSDADGNDSGVTPQSGMTPLSQATPGTPGSERKPRFYQGTTTPRGSTSSLGYARSALSVGDLQRLNDLFDNWTTRLSNTVEDQVNRSLVGLAGVTVATGSLAATAKQRQYASGVPASLDLAAPSPSKRVSVVDDGSNRVSQFDVKDMEYRLAEAVQDSKNNQSELMKSILESHNREIESLKESIASEREASVHAQRAMEHSLKQRVDNLSEALSVKVQQEADLRLTRAMELAQRQAQNDSAAIVKMYEAEKESELKVNSRFKEIVSELHASWEHEQSMRAEHLADVTSGHYKAVIDHLEKQLASSLSLQSEVDKRWLEELETRSKNQAETLYAFEEKCKNLYNERFRKYVKVSNKKLANYEKQLLEVGSTLASEKTRYDSRLRRVKWACLKWKRMYQTDVESRYVKSVEALENHYGAEIERLLHEVNETRSAISDSVARLGAGEKNLLNARLAQAEHDMAPLEGGLPGDGRTTADLVHELTLAWEKQRIPPEEKVRLLTHLLNEATPNAALMRTYDEAHAKLQSRLPILEMRSKKNYLEFKLRQLGDVRVNSEAAAVQRDLRDTEAEYEDACRQYQAKYGEMFEAAPAS